MPPIKFTEKHRQAFTDELKYFLGNDRFERARARGVYNKPMELLTFANKAFYYLEDSEAEECWALYSVDINKAGSSGKN